MKRQILVASVLVLGAIAQVFAADEGWISLFDGKTTEGWKVGENATSFRVEDGLLIANGKVAHLFYDGPVCQHNFKNFHFKADVMTMPKANSGIYFHTQYQAAGWPKIGYECQVNTTHSDPKKTAGLYNVKDVFEAPAKDGEWFTMEIIVQGKRIITKVNGKTLVDYTEPEKVEGLRRLTNGTFAIQAHDPGSKVSYKNIQVKPLPE
ncbi:MAG: DUF1080 domain-containing protein [Planctomycetota bacterium]|nr:DUF1080 domain-containing protein [Planctomycetota bacterium]